MLRLHIQRGSRIIQYKDRIFLRECPRNADALFLPAGKTNAALSDDRVILLIHALDKTVCPGVCRRFPHGFRINAVTFSQLYILADAVRKQENILNNYGNTAAVLF